MSKKNPYLLSAAQIRSWAAKHNEEAWLLLLSMLEGQNEFFMRKRADDIARAIQNVEAHLETGRIPKKRAAALRKMLDHVRSAGGKLDNEHKNLARKLSGLSGATGRLEDKLARVRTLQTKTLALDSRLVRDMQRAKEAARRREQEAKQKADLLIAKAAARAMSK